MHRIVARFLALLAILAAYAAAARDVAPSAASAAWPGGDAPPLALRWEPSVAGRRRLDAVALDPASGRLAIGDVRGVLLLGPDGSVEGSIVRPEVRALVFGGSGALLVGSSGGLYVGSSERDLEDRSPGPGAAARSIQRLATCHETVAAAPGASIYAVATGAGLYVSRDARRWQPLPGALSRAEVAAVALRCGPEGAELRAVAAGEVWQATLHASPGGELGSAEVEPVAGLDAGLRAGAVDVALEDDGSERVLGADRIALRAPGGRDWSVLRPTLAPGAVLLRIAFAAGHRWLATDRGLFVEAAAGAWARLPADGSLTAIRDIAGDASHVFAATEDGLLALPLESAAAARPDATLRRAFLRAIEFPAPREPAVDEVFRAALDYLALRPEELRNLRRGLAMRGLLPNLELRLQRDRSSDADRDYDEAFVSGDLRRLRDAHASSGRGVSASVHLSWELGELAFSRDAIDLSKEARAVIQLRDDVLDEITHLFFERRRVLLELAAEDRGQEPQQVARLRIRADELAAGLDAWTGGWFGQRVPRLAQ